MYQPKVEITKKNIQKKKKFINLNQSCKTVNNIYIYIERERERKREIENNHIFLGENVREIANLYKRK